MNLSMEVKLTGFFRVTVAVIDFTPAGAAVAAPAVGMLVAAEVVAPAVGALTEVGVTTASAKVIFVTVMPELVAKLLKKNEIKAR